MKDYKRIDTKLIHAGTPEPRIQGSVAMPIFQSAMYEYEGETSYHDLKYIRLNNSPNHLALHAKLAALENAEAALVAASGMAIISTTLLTVLAGGGHLLAQECLYGGTHGLLTKGLRRLWVRLRFHRRRRSGLLGGEVAAEYQIDLRRGDFDLCLHSATKCLNGHSDIVGGAVVGRADAIERIKHRMNQLGAAMDRHAVFLLNRGLKTLALRVRQQSQSALTIARFLQAHAAVARVNYPGLETHPRHGRARGLFDGFGGVLSFELKGPSSRAEAFIRGTRIPIAAPSLGGVESLLTLPARTSHAGLSVEDRHRLGIAEGLIRMSVGIEAIDELVEDLGNALEASGTV